ncbi:MAG: lipocalin-like domain-containing protein [Patescibacteria group bacterium]|nr:lipocalin-like domain-containing protein [Patescibacteria group bacterium]
MLPSLYKTRREIIVIGGGYLSTLLSSSAEEASNHPFQPEIKSMSFDAPVLNFNPLLLVGCWEYQAAYTLFPDGTTSYNFTPTPKGRFIILPNGRYSHIVMSPDLPKVASGQLKNLTDVEAQAIATNVLAHLGTWKADPAAGSFDVEIEWSSFPNFDGITQTRIITQLDLHTLSYENLQTTNGGDAKVIATLTRAPMF